MFTKRSPGTGPLLFVLSASAVLFAALALWFYVSGRQPGDDSAEAGFARDMTVHHAQAVEMAEIVRDRTRDSEIRALASDIALTQQAQIGQMQGWLSVWDLPATMIEGGGAFQEGSEMTAGPAVRHVLEAYYGVEQSPQDPYPTGTEPLGTREEGGTAGVPAPHDAARSAGRQVRR